MSSEWHLALGNWVFNPPHLRLARAHRGNRIDPNCRKRWLMGGNGGITNSDLISTVYESPVTRHFRNIAFHLSGGCRSLFEPWTKTYLIALQCRCQPALLAQGLVRFHAQNRKWQDGVQRGGTTHQTSVARIGTGEMSTRGEHFHIPRGLRGKKLKVFVSNVCFCKCVRR